LKDKKPLIYLSSMTKIEYEGHVLNVPTTWDDITVGHYESFHQDKPVTARERVALIAKICQVEPGLLLSWPADLFNILVEKTGFLFQESPAEPNPSIAVNGVTYVVAVEDKLSLGEYLDAVVVQKNEPAMFSNLLAILCRPAGEEYNPDNSEARAAMFAALPMGKVRGVLAFFLQCKQALELRTTAYTNLAHAVALLPLTIKDLRQRGGTIKLLRIWPMMKYFFLTKYLKFRLRRLLRSYNTNGTRPTLKRPKGSLTVN
jgi:hypothetical protein